MEWEILEVISILVFLDFNQAKQGRGVSEQSRFQSLFSWILTEVVKNGDGRSDNFNPCFLGF